MSKSLEFHHRIISMKSNITIAHAIIDILNKNLTEKLTSNTVSFILLFNVQKNSKLASERVVNKQDKMNATR